MPDVFKHYQNRQPGYTDEYAMRYAPQPDGTYKVFAVTCPADPHGKGAHVHHRYASSELCIASGREPRSLEMAEAIAHYWMLKYSEYVHSATGEFRDTGGRVNV